MYKIQKILTGQAENQNFMRKANVIVFPLNIKVRVLLHKRRFFRLKSLDSYFRGTIYTKVTTDSTREELNWTLECSVDQNEGLSTLPFTGSSSLTTLFNRNQ